jgi:undecaprenyl-diphosphatase
VVTLKPILIQAVTEFLPVSSGAHLLLFCKGLVTPEILHLGTIIPTLIYFRRSLFPYFFRVSLGTIPTVLIGYFIKKYTSYTLMASFTKWGMLAGALFMLFAELTPNVTQKKVSFKNAFIIGLFQCLAFIPGFSRLGATLSAARILGIERNESATFSFLLSIPASLGAVVLANPPLNDLITLSPYLALETLVGYASLWSFMRCHNQFVILLLVLYRLLIFWWLL